jgi:hypothetical protein
MWQPANGYWNNNGEKKANENIKRENIWRMKWK